jgi:RNA polymerase sigma factor (sigma-70 family)
MPENNKIDNPISNAAQFHKAIKANDEKALQSLYINNFKKIESLVLNNNGTTEQAKDIYQEAFITVWRNVKNDKFSPDNETALNGYLYTIAKNKWMDYLGSSAYKKTVSINQLSNITTNDAINEESVNEEMQEQKLSVAMKAFQELGEACKTLLTKFYFEKKTMKEIALELKLDAASTRNKKYRCMQALRVLALEMNK